METASFELGGDIMLEIDLDPIKPKAGAPTHVTAKFSSAYGRPMSKLSVRVSPVGGESTSWVDLKMTKAWIWDPESDDIVEADSLDAQGEDGEYGASVYEGDVVFPAGDSQLEFKNSDDISMDIDFTVTAN